MGITTITLLRIMVNYGELRDYGDRDYGDSAPNGDYGGLR